MYKNSCNKGKLYQLAENEYGDLPLPLPLGPGNEKKFMWHSKVQINSKVALEFRNEDFCF